MIFVNPSWYSAPLSVDKVAVSGELNLDSLISQVIRTGSLRASSISLGDKVTLSNDGKVKIEGELVVAGTIVLEGDMTISGKVEAKIVAAEEFKVKSAENTEDGKSQTTAGAATLLKDTKELVIETTKVEENSLIFITPTKLTNEPLAVIEKISGESFKVSISKLATEDITFNWIIVNQISDSESAGSQ